MFKLWGHLEQGTFRTFKGTHSDVSLATVGKGESLGGSIGGDSIVQRLHSGVIQSLLHVVGLGLEGNVCS